MIMIFGTLVLNDNTSRCLFNFFEIFIFWAVSGDKRAKNCPKWKKKQLHRTSAISQEQYNICSLFLVHLYKIISPGYHFTQVKFFFFSFFQNFLIFFSNFYLSGCLGGVGGVVLGGGGEANILSLELHVSETIHDMTLINGIDKRIISLGFWGFFCIFSKF